MTCNNIINLHCDGCCLDNGKPSAKGGYGIVVEKNGQVLTTLYGKLRAGRQTNNRAELEAIIQTLQYIKESHYECVNIYSDSKTIIDGMNGESQRKSNVDLWEIVERLCQELSTVDIAVFHCNKDELTEYSDIYKFNVQADALAYKGANALIINRR